MKNQSFVTSCSTSSLLTIPPLPLLYRGDEEFCQHLKPGPALVIILTLLSSPQLVLIHDHFLDQFLINCLESLIYLLINCFRELHDHMQVQLPLVYHMYQDCYFLLNCDLCLIPLPILVDTSIFNSWFRCTFLWWLLHFWFRFW